MSAPLRYVVLHHEGVAEPHFDLMIESSPGGSLLTWRSPVWPIESKVQLTRLGEHRRDYLEYEGPISENRGRVRRISAGECSLTWISSGECTIEFGSHMMAFRQIEAEQWAAGPITG